MKVRELRQLARGFIERDRAPVTHTFVEFCSLQSSLYKTLTGGETQEEATGTQDDERSV